MFGSSAPDGVGTELSAPRFIEFWFDFASGYAYFAALDIDALAERHGRVVLWNPFCLGSSFQVTGSVNLSVTPLKGEYASRDWNRLARLKGVPFSPPPGHPMAGLPALRAFTHAADIDPNAAADLAKRLLFGYFQNGLNIDDPEAVVAVASRVGFDADAVLARIADPAVKARAKVRGDEAVARGVFGSPWFFIDGEPFWGHDRLPLMELWLERGAW